MMNLADYYRVGGGALSVLILVLDVVAVVSVLQERRSALGKLLWILAIVFLPLIGMILYFLLGRSGGTTPS